MTTLREKFGIGGEGVIVGFCKTISKMSILQKKVTLIGYITKTTNIGYVHQTFPATGVSGKDVYGG